jgi:hypothetical protein
MQILHFPPTAYFLLPRLLARIGSLIYGEPIGLSRGLRESDVGQNPKSSMGAYVFRFAPGSGHRAMQAARPSRANKRHWTATPQLKDAANLCGLTLRQSNYPA